MYGRHSVKFQPEAKVRVVEILTVVPAAPTTVTSWSIGARPIPSPLFCVGSMVVCTVLIRVSEGGW